MMILEHSVIRTWHLPLFSAFLILLRASARTFMCTIQHGKMAERAKPAFSLSSFTFIKRLFSSSLLSAIRVVLSACLWLLLFLPEILIPAWALSSPAFCMMYSAYKLNKQNDNIQPWHTPFPIWNQSVVPSPVLTVASWPAYRFLRRQVRWSGIPISWNIFQFVVITLSLWINLEKTYMLMLLRL